MFSLDLLDLVLLIGIMFPILVKLREARSHIVNEQLRQLFIRLNDETEKLSMIVVNDLA
jgi:hypothetical protein